MKLVFLEEVSYYLMSNKNGKHALSKYQILNIMHNLPTELIEIIHLNMKPEDLVNLSTTSHDNLEFLGYYFQRDSHKTYPIDFIVRLYIYCCENDILHHVCNLCKHHVYLLEKTHKFPNNVMHKMYKLCLSRGDLSTYIDLGMLFYSEGKYEIAFNYFTLSEEHCPNSINMCFVYRQVGIMYSKGKGVDVDNNTTLSYLIEENPSLLSKLYEYVDI